MNRHLYNHNQDILDILDEGEKLFPRKDLGAEGIPLEGSSQMWVYSMIRAGGARAAFEWLRDRLNATMELGYEPAQGPEEPINKGPQSVVDYLEDYHADVLKTQDPQAPSD